MIEWWQKDSKSYCCYTKLTNTWNRENGMDLFELCSSGVDYVLKKDGDVMFKLTSDQLERLIDFLKTVPRCLYEGFGANINQLSVCFFELGKEQRFWLRRERVFSVLAQIEMVEIGIFNEIVCHQSDTTKITIGSYCVEISKLRENSSEWSSLKIPICTYRELCKQLKSKGERSA